MLQSTTILLHLGQFRLSMLICKALLEPHICFCIRMDSWHSHFRGLHFAFPCALFSELLFNFLLCVPLLSQCLYNTGLGYTNTVFLLEKSYKILEEFSLEILEFFGSALGKLICTWRILKGI